MKGSRLITIIIFTLLVAFFTPQIPLAESASDSIVLRYTYHEPPPPPPPAKPSSTVGMHYWLGEQLEKRTEGRVKLKYFPGSVLGKPFDFATMIGGKGVADIGMIPAGFFVNTIPLWAGGSMLFLMDDAEIGPRAMWELYQEWPAMQNEWEKLNIKPLIYFTTIPDALAIKTPVTSFDDLKGKKIGGGGRIAFLAKQADFLHVGLPIGEIYDALNKGVIDGVIAPYHTVKAFKWYESAKYLVSMEVLGRGGFCTIAINKDIWNKISPGDQKVIEEISAEWQVVYKQSMAEGFSGLNNYYEKQGMTITTFSPEEIAKVKKEYADKIWANWVQGLKKKGLPGDEFLQRYEAKINGLK